MKLTWRIWFLIILLIASALILFPSFEKGVVIKSVEKNSTAFDSGLKNDMIIKSINGKTINNFDDFLSAPSKPFMLSHTLPIANKITVQQKKVAEGIELNAEYLNEHPEKKEEIKKRIIDIAEVSNGICEEEKMFIDHLINTLSL